MRPAGHDVISNVWSNSTITNNKMASCCPRPLTFVMSKCPEQPSEVSTNIISISETRKLRNRDPQYLAIGHTAVKQQEASPLQELLLAGCGPTRTHSIHATNKPLEVHRLGCPLQMVWSKGGIPLESALQVPVNLVAPRAHWSSLGSQGPRGKHPGGPQAPVARDPLPQLPR